MGSELAAGIALDTLVIVAMTIIEQVVLPVLRRRHLRRLFG